MKYYILHVLVLITFIQCYGMDEKDKKEKKKSRFLSFVFPNKKQNDEKNREKKYNSLQNLIFLKNNITEPKNLKKKDSDNTIDNESPVIKVTGETPPRESLEIKRLEKRNTIEKEKSPKNEDLHYKLIKQKSFIIKKNYNLDENSKNICSEEQKEISKKLLQEKIDEYTIEQDNNIITIEESHNIIKIKKKPKTDIQYLILTYDKSTEKKEVIKTDSFSNHEEKMDSDSMNIDLKDYLKNVKQPKKDLKEFTLEDETQESIIILQEVPEETEDNKKNTILNIIKRPKNGDLPDTVFSYECSTKKKSVFIKNSVLGVTKEMDDNVMDKELKYLIKNLDLLKKELTEDNGGCNIVSMLTNLKIQQNEQEKKNN